MTGTSHARVDVAIVGAGPAGCATALALLAQGARVALIERRGKPEDRMGESLHGIAGAALRELGVWEAFQGLEQRPSYFHLAAWGGRTEERASLRSRYGPDLHLDRAAFDGLLVDTAAARGATVIRPATVRRLSLHGGLSLLTVAREHDLLEIAAGQVVDATGRGATLARRFGAERRNADRLIGVARSFDRGSREPSTLVEAANDGWWYSGPQPGGRMVALFLTDGESPLREARKKEVWERCLETAPLTRERLRDAESESSPRAYLASPGILDWDPNQPMLPVGDAALSFDPISAEGLSFALRSGIEAAAALLRTRGSRSAYRDGIRAIFRGHLARREQIYESERRVRPTVFWQRPRDLMSAAP